MRNLFIIHLIVLHPASKRWEREAGRMKRAWAVCQLFRFELGGGKTILLTSPFIEPNNRKEWKNGLKSSIVEDLVIVPNDYLNS
jgi:hypothetical protein